jgi:hypothetical protein
MAQTRQQYMVFSRQYSASAEQQLLHRTWSTTLCTSLSLLCLVLSVWSLFISSQLTLHLASTKQWSAGLPVQLTCTNWAHHRCHEGMLQGHPVHVEPAPGPRQWVQDSTAGSLPTCPYFSASTPGYCDQQGPQSDTYLPPALWVGLLLGGRQGSQPSPGVQQSHDEVMYHIAPNPAIFALGCVLFIIIQRYMHKRCHSLEAPSAPVIAPDHPVKLPPDLWEAVHAAGSTGTQQVGIHSPSRGHRLRRMRELDYTGSEGTQKVGVLACAMVRGCAPLRALCSNCFHPSQWQRNA